MTTTALKRVATYERTSSEDQRDRETIKTQSEELARRLASDPTVGRVTRYIDDGISGTIPMAERPQGRRLLEAAAAREFDELWIYNIKEGWEERPSTSYSYGGDLNLWASAW
jgi:site-specific DNA recombinase